MEPFEMRRHRTTLDDDTVERLLDLRMGPDDAPPGYAEAARLLSQAAATPVAAPVDPELVSSMVQAISSSPYPSSPREPAVPTKRFTAKIATTAAVVLFSTAGAAAAATGSLPAPAQDALAKAADHVGFELPRSTKASAKDDHPTPEDHPTADDAAAEDEGVADADHPTGNTDNPTDADQHGVDVSEAAHDKDVTGRNHGADVSAVARDGHGPDSTSTTVADDDDDAGDAGTNGTPNEHAAAQATARGANAGDNPGAGHRP